VVVEAEHERIAAARHINAPGVVVGINVINAAAPHELCGIEHLIWRVRLSESVAGEQTDARHR